jgi:hypothetical protein
MKRVKILILVLITAFGLSMLPGQATYSEEFQKKPRKTKVTKKKKTQTVKGYTTKTGKKVKSYKRKSR